MGPNCDPLDPGLLRKIDRTAKADKNIFLTSFLREQRENARTYAAQGQLEMKAWKDHTTPYQRQDTASNLHVLRSPAISKTLSRIDFDTPVLKPRNRHKVQDTQRSDISPPLPLAKSVKNRTAYVVDHPPSPASQSKSRPRDRHPLSPKAQKSSKALTKPASKKRIACDDHSDEDQVARLEERRERKRAKRAIVNPEKADIVVEPGTSYSEAKGKKAKGKGKGKREKGSEKTPAAYALMHGFVATNVGKNRLTMKTPVPVGVFNKGKASEKTRIKDTSAVMRTKNTFSEGLFLQGTRKKEPTSKKRHRTLSTSSSSCTTSPSRSRARRHRENESVHEKETLPSPMKDEAGRCVSEVWDIESEASEESKIRTLILDGLRGWNVPASPQTPPAGGQSKGAPTSPHSADDLNVRSSPFLRPSQSASQCAWNGMARLPAARSAISRSKYFTQAKAIGDNAAPTVNDIAGQATDTAAKWHYTEMPPPPRPVPAERRPRDRAHRTRKPTPPVYGAAPSKDPPLEDPLPGALSNEVEEPRESVLDDGSFVTHNYFSECLAFSDGCINGLSVQATDLCDDLLLAAEVNLGVLNGDATALGWDIDCVALCTEDGEATASEADALEAAEHPGENFIGGAFDAFLDRNGLDHADDLDIYPCGEDSGEVKSFVAGAFDYLTTVAPDHDLVHFADGHFAAEGYESSADYEEDCAADLPAPCDGHYSDVDYTDCGDDWASAGEWSDDSGGSLWIGQDPEVDSELNEDELIFSLHAFAEGKALLMGVPNTPEVLSVAHGRVSQAEADVARSLHDHWTPYRPL
ncbi:hypothetical protein K523DRAFT_419131 [Schizophyllum commune Tattone D]|nr:hypothetical protein K523DRAFT_419131 [Schizophyllum commune Tattone D]